MEEVRLHEGERQLAVVRIGEHDGGLLQGGVGDGLIGVVDALAHGVGGSGRDDVPGGDDARGGVGGDDGDKAVEEGHVAGAAGLVPLPQALLELGADFGKEFGHGLLFEGHDLAARADAHLVHKVLVEEILRAPRLVDFHDAGNDAALGEVVVASGVEGAGSAVLENNADIEDVDGGLALDVGHEGE